MLRHIPYVEEAINQIYEILNDEGEVIAMTYNKNSIPYWKMILIERLLSKLFFKGETVEETMARIEKGASEELKTYVTCHTARESRILFSGFGNTRIEAHALSPREIPLWKLPYKARSLESKVGWFLMVRGCK